MAKATVTKRFRDIEAGKIREVGETFEASEQRLSDINAAARKQGFEAFVSYEAEEKPKPQRKPRKKAPAEEGE